MATTIKNGGITRRSYKIKINPPINARIQANKEVVRVRLNNQIVAETMKPAAPPVTSTAAAQTADPHDANGLGDIATGRFIASAKKSSQSGTSAKGSGGSGNNGELPIAVGPITPIP